MQEQGNPPHILKDVKVDELNLFSGRVVHDVVSSNGSLLLPRGIQVKTIQETMPDIVSTLKEWGIHSVLLDISFNMSEEDFDAIIGRIEQEKRVLDSAVANRAIKQVDEVYRRISETGSMGDGARELAQQAVFLAEEVARTPQIMLCLGRVHESDEYTFVHSLNVSLLCGYLAARIKPGDSEFAVAMTFGGLLHDLGKAKMPREVLNKPGKLTESEYEIMKTHSLHGDELARSAGVSDARVLSVIRNHHERWSGQGYPDGLNRDSIPIFARIAAVADVFDALTAKRIYKDPKSSREVISMMLEASNSEFDKEVVRTLLLAVGLYPPGMTVELSDNSMGVVIGAGNTDIFRPRVYLSLDGEGRPLAGGTIVDLGKQSGLFIRRALNDAGKRLSGSLCG